ncbi:hypothetical protein TNCV_3046451 [Trichonephila clavipes]|uniref:Tc1-like transposase DDE domain-containing protein n=1 Tax=Trichonephila clavipes TaxID=2585209 RepID=A0A8X6V5A1_TRICX|nr:hypothetical protein TNCV_3046451 [Trichonephila clavipes]
MLSGEYTRYIWETDYPDEPSVCQQCLPNYCLEKVAVSGPPKQIARSFTNAYCSSSVTKFWNLHSSTVTRHPLSEGMLYESAFVDYVHRNMRIRFPQVDGIYRQNNAKCHTARSTCTRFEEQEDEFTVLSRPANSPDLNQ